MLTFGRMPFSLPPPPPPKPPKRNLVRDQLAVISCANLYFQSLFQYEFFKVEGRSFKLNSVSRDDLSTNWKKKTFTIIVSV